MGGSGKETACEIIRKQETAYWEQIIHQNSRRGWQQDVSSAVQVYWEIKKYEEYRTANESTYWLFLSSCGGSFSAS